MRRPRHEVYQVAFNLAHYWRGQSEASGGKCTYEDWLEAQNRLAAAQRAAVVARIVAASGLQPRFAELRRTYGDDVIALAVLAYEECQFGQADCSA